MNCFITSITLTQNRGLFGYLGRGWSPEPGRRSCWPWRWFFPSVTWLLRHKTSRQLRYLQDIKSLRSVSSNTLVTYTSPHFPFTCSESDDGPGQEHVVFVVRRRQVHVRVVHVSCNVDDYRTHKRLLPRPVIGPKSKQGRCHHLSQAKRSYDPAQETSVCAVVYLKPQNNTGV